MYFTNGSSRAFEMLMRGKPGFDRYENGGCADCEDCNIWLLCPICKNKTRIKVRGDTELINFPLYCPKCKQETLINVKRLNTTVIKEPDAQTQSR